MQMSGRVPARKGSERCVDVTLGSGLVAETVEPGENAGMPALVETIPLVTDSVGGLRIPGTRVRLEDVVYAYRGGKSVEQILEDYPVLSLNQVYPILGYYLNHTGEVDAYLARRQREEADLLAAHPEWQPVGLLARLRARTGQD